VTRSGGVGSGAAAVAPPNPRAAPPRRRATPVLRLLFVALALYVAFGKGFAYAGWPPLFVGEVLLVVVLASALATPMALPRQWPAWLTLALVGTAAVQAAIELMDGGSSLEETVRGLAPVYYAGFAFGLYALLRDWENRVGSHALLDDVERGLGLAAPPALAVLGVLGAVALAQPTWLPAWPVSGVPILLTKSGDIAVALVLVLPGLAAAGSERTPRWRAVVMAGWVLVALLMAFRSRGALLALAVGLVVMRPQARRLARGAFAIVSLVVVLYATGARIELDGREVSFAAIGDATTSVLGGKPEDQIGSNYVGTTNWRASWWQAIWDDVTGNAMVLHGHGWGDNLAVRYHIVPPVAAEDPRVLRLPHDVFFSLAGRAGLAFAIGFLIVPVATVAATFGRGRRGRPPLPVQAARGAIAAAVTTGLTDIYLESPQGGIVFWCLIGFLWWVTAARANERDDPERAA
jgi:hypothetical protein